MNRALIVASLIYTLAAVPVAAQAQVRLPSTAVCITFGTSTDLLEGEASPRWSRAGVFNLAMVEKTFDRAATGSIALANGRYRVALSKPTNTANVVYQCDIAADQLNGQCSVMVFSAQAQPVTLINDVGYLAFGSCGIAAPAQADVEPAAGE